MLLHGTAYIDKSFSMNKATVILEQIEMSKESISGLMSIKDALKQTWYDLCEIQITLTIIREESFEYINHKE